MKNKGYSSFITNKYGFNLSDLALHYLLICGEIPNDLIEKIFGKNNWKFIAYKSKYQGLFISKQKDRLKGFQLSKKAIKYMDQLKYDYTPYLSPDGHIREVTTDVYKRDRYRRAMNWYYILDKWGIDYLQEKRSQDKYFFLDSRIIKNYFSRIRYTFAGSSDKNFQIAGSKSYGMLDFSDDSFYSIYMSDSSILNLSYNTERRYCDFAIQKCFNGDPDARYGQAILFKYFFSPQRVFAGTALLLLTEEKEFNFYLDVYFDEMGKFVTYTKNIYDSFMSYNRFLGMPLIYIFSRKQIDYFFNRKYYNMKIRKLLYKKQGETFLEREKEIWEKHPADTVYNNLPCVFLLDLDVYKFFRVMKHSLYNRIPYVFICMKDGQKIIEHTLYNIYYYNSIDVDINVIAIEDLGGDDFFR